MAVLLSKEFNIRKGIIAEKGVFDVLLDKDSNFFINVKRLQKTQIPEFKNSYTKVIEYFRHIAVLLKASKERGDKLYNSALIRFNFPEVKGINLGFSTGKRGAGFGPELRDKIISDAQQIIKAGVADPEIFLLTSLFEENVGPDRLSDMVARIIFDEIVNYSRRIYGELGITEENFPEMHFSNGILINPYMGRQLYLLPAEILHELPIAIDWDDIDRVCRENEAIRAELNEAIAAEWYRMTSAEKKQHLKEQIFNDPERTARVVQAFKEAEVEQYDLKKNPDYYVDLLLCEFKLSALPEKSGIDSFVASMHVLNHFKHWVEYQRGWFVIQETSSRSREKVVQRMLHGIAYMYCKEHGWDISPEEDGGRGPVDFKISCQNDKTIIEIKLTSNQQCEHGYEVQIEEYAKAEETDKKIFVIVNTGTHPERIGKVLKLQKTLTAAGKEPAEIIVIDATAKESASTYKSKDN